MESETGASDFGAGADGAGTRGKAALRALVASLLMLSGAALSAPSRAHDDGHRVVLQELDDGKVRIEARGAGVPEVIEALSRSLGLEIRGAVPKTDVKVTRTFEGRLDTLIAQLLPGVSYVLATEGGAPRRLIFLPGSGAKDAQPYAAMTVEQLRKKEGELVAQIAQYEDFSVEARERSRPQLAQKFERHLSELSQEVAAVRRYLQR